jgi:hypothetical protein
MDPGAVMTTSRLGSSSDATQFACRRGLSMGSRFRTSAWNRASLFAQAFPRRFSESASISRHSRLSAVAFQTNHPVATHAASAARSRKKVGSRIYLYRRRRKDS